MASPVSTHNMSFEQLCSYSDFASLVVTDLFIGQKTFKTGISFLPAMSRSSKCKIKTLLQRAQSGYSSTDVVWKEMKSVFAIQSYLRDKSSSEIREIDLHCIRYLNVVHSQSEFSVVKCNRYEADEGEGVKIIAKADIPRDSIIEGLELCISTPTTTEEYATLTERAKNYLFEGNRMGLGPAAWINHSCEPNVCFVWLLEDNTMGVEAIQSIKAGQEIIVKYRENFFGEDCMCDVCEQ